MNNEKRAELIKQAMRSIHEETPVEPIFNYICTYAMKKNIEFNPTKNINFDICTLKIWLLYSRWSRFAVLRTDLPLAVFKLNRVPD